MRLRQGKYRLCGSVALMTMFAIQGHDAANQGQTGLSSANADKMVPGFLLAAARGSTEDLGSAFAEAQVPAGLIISREYVSEPATTPWRRETRLPDVPLNRVLTEISRLNPRLSITYESGVVMIREDRVQVDSDLLQRRVPAATWRPKAAVVLLGELVASVAPQYPAPRGGLGSFMGDPSRAPLSVSDINGPLVTLELNGETFLEALVAVTARAPGLAWTLRVPAANDVAATKRGDFDLLCFLPGGVTHKLGGAGRS